MKKTSKLTGEERKKAILEAAENLIVDEGYAAFTARRVAAMAGIKLASLQYYFPTRGDLLKDTVENILARYIAFTDQEVAAAGDDPRDQLRAGVRWLLEDIQTSPRTSRLFPQLWALANHNEHARDALDQLMTEYRQNLARWISAVNPALSALECERRGAVVSAMIEGTTIVVGNGKPKHDATEGIDIHIIDMAVELASKP